MREPPAWRAYDTAAEDSACLSGNAACGCKKRMGVGASTLSLLPNGSAAVYLTWNTDAHESPSIALASTWSGGLIFLKSEMSIRHSSSRSRYRAAPR